MMKNSGTVPREVKRLSAKLPHFPDGRISYKNAKLAAAVIVFIKCRGKVLILKRSGKVRAYKGKWDGISGYYDRLVAPEEIALNEVREEVGIKPSLISKVRLGKKYKFTDRKIGETWIVFPITIWLKKTPRVTLNWENVSYRWVRPNRLSLLDSIPRLAKKLEYASYYGTSPAKRRRE